MQVHDLKRNLTRQAKPTDALFYTNRSWDARAERGYMNTIEKDFQELATSMMSGASLDQASKVIIDRFFSLWRRRHEYKDKSLEEISFCGITGDTLTSEQEESLEKEGVLFYRKGGKTPAHRIFGMEIQIAIDHDCHSLSNVCWGQVTALDSQFLVPDCPAAHYIPIHPTLCLMGAEKPWPTGAVMDGGNVVLINKALRDGCTLFYFANDLTQALAPA